MANRISKELKAKAFTLYCLQVPQKKIGDLLTVKAQTINKWVTREKWVDRRGEIDSLKKGVSEMSVNDRHLALAQAIEGNVAKGLYEGKLDATARDGLEAIKTERLILGMSTENVAQNVKQTVIVSYGEEKPKLKEKEEPKEESK